MLEGLDGIDWSSLEHAYGEAGDVPDMIRALASEDAEVREDAFWSAYGNIFHQGTRYEATVAAVPFLLEILGDDDYPDLAQLLAYLASLVIGYDEPYLPVGFGYEIAGMRAELAMLDGRSEEAKAREDADESPTNADWLRWITSISDEVRKGVPRLVELLRHEDSEVRIQAAYLAAWLPEEFDALSDPLWQCVASDTDPNVRGNALIALATCAHAGNFEPFVERVIPHLDDAQPLVRFASALALGSQEVDYASEKVVEILVRVLVDSSREDSHVHEWYFPWFSEEVGAMSTETLALVCANDPDRVFSPASRAIPEMSTLEAASTVYVLLRLYFPQGFLGESAADLDAGQLKLLNFLAVTPNPWMMGEASFANFSQAMRDYGLPSSMESLAAFLAG